jgi:hypothetical protein
MWVIINPFGYYHFDEVSPALDLHPQRHDRGYTFTPRVVRVTDELTDEPCGIAVRFYCRV